MGYSRVHCRAGVFALLALFLVPTLWGTLLCSLPCYGTDIQGHENHLHVDFPGVGQVARGLRTGARFEVEDFIQLAYDKFSLGQRPRYDP